MRKEHGCWVDQLPLGLPESTLMEAVKRFKQAFFPAYRSPFGIQRLGEAWMTETRPGRYLTDTKCAKHLEGRYYVAPAGRAMTKILAVDLDGHDAEAERTLFSRADKTIGAVPEARPLVFSTPRGGLHVVWVLDTPSWSVRARAYLQARLETAGLVERPGRVELFPAGQKLLRAPLGRGCFLLDPFSLVPVVESRWGCIEILDDLLELEKVDRLVVPADYNATRVRDCKGGLRDQREFHAGSVSPFMQRIDCLLGSGLQAPGTRNAAFLDLSWYYRVALGYEAEQAAEALWAWVQANHKGHSKDFERDPEGVRRHCLRVAEACDPQKAGDGGRGGSGGGGRLNAARAYADGLEDLSDRQKRLLAHFIVRAGLRGELEGDFYRVRVPSRTLQTWVRTYGQELPGLAAKGLVLRGSGYSTRGLAQEYRVPAGVVKKGGV